MTFLQDMGLVIALAVAVIVSFVLWKVGPEDLIPFLKTKQGKGVARGIILAPTIIVLIAVVGAALLPKKAHAQVPGTWFNDASVFMGIDHTKKLSPMCYDGGYDDRSTSNMGAKLNIWQSPSGNVRFNTLYTHHSCAINPDRKSYDAIGVQVEWKFWQR